MKQVIANSLARNPCVEYLDHSCNNLNDVDVSRLAASNKCAHDGMVRVRVRVPYCSQWQWKG